MILNRILLIVINLIIIIKILLCLLVYCCNLGFLWMVYIGIKNKINVMIGLMMVLIIFIMEGLI